MPITLDPLEQRIVGAMIEKETTVPETYPLTINALVAAVNQKSNRDPEMHAEDYEVEGALRALRERSWVGQLEREGGRTLRYAHRAGEQLGVDAHDLAILSELLCRGPQTPQELKTRCSRMRPFASPEEVERRLQALAARPVPYVKLLERRPRERDARWTHLLGPAAAPSETPSSAPDAAPRPAAAPTSSMAPPPPASLADRVAALEREVAALKSRLDASGA